MVQSWYEDDLKKNTVVCFRFGIQALSQSRLLSLCPAEQLLQPWDWHCSCPCWLWSYTTPTGKWHYQDASSFTGYPLFSTVLFLRPHPCAAPLPSRQHQLRLPAKYPPFLWFDVYCRQFPQGDTFPSPPSPSPDNNLCTPSPGPPCFPQILVFITVMKTCGKRERGKTLFNAA